MKNVNIINWGQWKIAWASADNTNAVNELLNAGRIDGIGLSPHHGFDGNAAIFANLSAFSGLVVTDADFLNLDCIPNLREMKFISLGGVRSQSCNFNGFQNLVELRLSWHPYDVLPGIDAPLESLYLKGYKPNVTDLSHLPVYARLISLELVQSDVVSLDSIQRLSSLRNLDIAYCRRLKSISALILTNLERVHLENCPNVEDIPVLAKCPHLKSIRLSNCGNLSSLKFLLDSRTIEEFRFVKMGVLDGDMTPLMKLKSVGFINKRCYSHTCEQVNAAINDALGHVLKVRT